MNLISKFMRLKSESFTEIHLRENAHPFFIVKELDCKRSFK